MANPEAGNQPAATFEVAQADLWQIAMSSFTRPDTVAVPVWTDEGTLAVIAGSNQGAKTRNLQIINNRRADGSIELRLQYWYVGIPFGVCIVDGEIQDLDDLATDEAKANMCAYMISVIEETRFAANSSLAYAKEVRAAHKARGASTLRPELLFREDPRLLSVVAFYQYLQRVRGINGHWE